jgi:hypothetical protein
MVVGVFAPCSLAHYLNSMPRDYFAMKLQLYRGLSKVAKVKIWSAMFIIILAVISAITGTLFIGATFFFFFFFEILVYSLSVAKPYV